MEHTSGNADNIRSVYVDSSPDNFDDPKVETVIELLKRIWVSDKQELCRH